MNGRCTRYSRLGQLLVGHAHAGVGLLDEPDDLFVYVPALAHRASSRLRGFFSIALVQVTGCEPVWPARDIRGLARGAPAPCAMEPARCMATPV